MNATEFMERFWARVVKTETCWLWVGARSATGYGNLKIKGKSVSAHHILKGKPPKGMVADHLCRTRSCVRPSHIEHVTNKTNVLRGEGLAANNARMTVCQHGHEFTEANTGRDGDGYRICRACARNRNRAYRINRGRAAAQTVAIAAVASPSALRSTSERG